MQSIISRKCGYDETQKTNLNFYIMCIAIMIVSTVIASSLYWKFCSTSSKVAKKTTRVSPDEITMANNNENVFLETEKVEATFSAVVPPKLEEIEANNNENLFSETDKVEATFSAAVVLELEEIEENNNPLQEQMETTQSEVVCSRTQKTQSFWVSF
jgi:hypothetical protein